MQHLVSILWLTAWPVSIWLSYRIIVFLLNKIEKDVSNKKEETKA